MRIGKKSGKLSLALSSEVRTTKAQQLGEKAPELSFLSFCFAFYSYHGKVSDTTYKCQLRCTLSLSLRMPRWTSFPGSPHSESTGGSEGVGSLQSILRHKLDSGAAHVAHPQRLTWTYMTFLLCKGTQVIINLKSFHLKITYRKLFS